MSLDRFLSGNYTILGMKYYWKLDNETRGGATHGSWGQEVTIGRREWTVPDKHPIKPSERVGTVEAQGIEITTDTTRASAEKT